MIIERITEAEVEGAKRIVANPDMTPPQKLCAILLGQGQTEEQENKTFSTDYPQETVELFIAAGQFIFDQGLFKWSGEELARRATAYVEMMEKTLGVSPGYFDDVKKAFVYS